MLGMLLCRALADAGNQLRRIAAVQTVRRMMRHGGREVIKVRNGSVLIN